jgi:hypothetical protein
MKYAPAEPLLRTYIPKSSGFEPTSRAAAIWALGYLHADQPDEALAEQLRQRLTDVNSEVPEEAIVRRFSAITLGRMKASSQLSSLKRMAAMDGPHSPPGVACMWAIQQITGEPIPDIPPIILRDNNWFLVPYFPSGSSGTRPESE